MREPKVLIFDVETTTIELAIQTYGLKNYIKYFNHKDVTRDWSMLGASWKYHGKKKVYANTVDPKDIFNDEKIVRELYDALASADVIIGHNSDKFDLLKFNTRALHYRLPPLDISTRMTVDTLKLARKYFALTSNSLAYIADFLGVPAKDNSPDWTKILNGDAKELRYMKKYNKQDVLVTEQVYDIIKGWDSRHPNIDAVADIRDCLGDKVDVCKTCLSPNLIKNGYMLTRVGKRLRKKCVSCGATQQGKLVK